MNDRLRSLLEGMAKLSEAQSKLTLELKRELNRMRAPKTPESPVQGILDEISSIVYSEPAFEEARGEPEPQYEYVPPREDARAASRRPLPSIEDLDDDPVEDMGAHHATVRACSGYGRREVQCSPRAFSLIARAMNGKVPPGGSLRVQDCWAPDATGQEMVTFFRDEEMLGVTWRPKGQTQLSRNEIAAIVDTETRIRDGRAASIGSIQEGANSFLKPQIPKGGLPGNANPPTRRETPRTAADVAGS